MSYLDHNSPEAFWDFPDPKPKRKGMDKSYEICHKCQGFGGWNLQLNAYPLHDRKNTSANRHRFSHFKALCNVCNGWGWTKNQCDHKLLYVKNLGRCYNQYKCEKCGSIFNIDSSD